LSLAISTAMTRAPAHFAIIT
jgi:hypothetical protein